jgi:hypothetical protein
MIFEQTRTDSNSNHPDGWGNLPEAPDVPAKQASLDRRPRRLTAEAVKTDMLLSHAIEYLTDAREIPSGKVTELWPEQPDVQAILLMMDARQRVYLDCPAIERRSFLGLLGTFKGPERRRR